MLQLYIYEPYLIKHINCSRTEDVGPKQGIQNENVITVTGRSHTTELCDTIFIRKSGAVCVELYGYTAQHIPRYVYPLV